MILSIHRFFFLIWEIDLEREEPLTQFWISIPPAVCPVRTEAQTASLWVFVNTGRKHVYCKRHLESCNTSEPLCYINFLLALKIHAKLCRREIGFCFHLVMGICWTEKENSSVFQVKVSLEEKPSEGWSPLLLCFRFFFLMLVRKNK